MCGVAFDIGRSWDSISPPLESRTTTFSVETYGKYELKLVTLRKPSNLSLMTAEGHFYKLFSVTIAQKDNSSLDEIAPLLHLAIETIREAPRVKMLDRKDESKDLKTHWNSYDFLSFPS